jgi:DNA-binding PadR family transcriptional regulator
MNELDEIYANFVVELRRGITNLVVLNQCQQPTYGYQLVKELSESGIPLEANTVYPLLRRLEDQNLLRSDWDTSTDKPRKYYQITEKGRQLLARITSYWRESVKNIEFILEA